MVANVTAEQIEAKKARVAEALRLHDEGLSIKQTAERMGVAHETVRRYLRANGIPFVKKQTNKGTRKLPCGSASLCPAAAVMLFANGMTQTMIANMFGCSQNAVSHALRKRNVSTSRGRRPNIAKRERAVEMASAGMSYYEVGRLLGVSNATVSKWARKAGIVRGKGGGCVARNNAARSSKAAPKRMARVRDAIGERFEVVRETRKDWFLLRCRECGHEFERFVDLHCKTECPECHRLKVERNERERKMAQMRRALVRALHGMLRVKEREEREREFLDTVHVCKECGREFTLRELRESNPWNFSDSPTFCSLSCSHRYHGRISKHRRREKKRAGDCDLSLRELDERDNHTCYLCGGQTDWNDYRVDGSGNFVAGDMYPSMDHVIPLVAGGTHTHGNLRIAHRLCNALKGDRSVEEAMAAIAARLEGVPG